MIWIDIWICLVILIENLHNLFCSVFSTAAKVIESVYFLELAWHFLERLRLQIESGMDDTMVQMETDGR